MTEADIHRNYSYYPPSSESIKGLHEDIREEVKKLALFVNGRLPESRELSLFHTALEQAMYHANAAIARNMN